MDSRFRLILILHKINLFEHGKGEKEGEMKGHSWPWSEKKLCRSRYRFFSIAIKLFDFGFLDANSGQIAGHEHPRDQTLYQPRQKRQT